MSALGQKQTNRLEIKSDFVRYRPKADKRGCGWNVCFVPIAGHRNKPDWLAIRLARR